MNDIFTLTVSQAASKPDNLGFIEKSIRQTAESILKDAPSLVVAYLDYGVRIGRWDRGSFSFHDTDMPDDRSVQRIRIFNADRELHIWRTPEGLRGRLRADGNGPEIRYIDTAQALFGTAAELEGEYTRIFEERGTEIYLPFTGVDVDPGRKRAFLRARNYIGYNETGQAGYIDCRFLGFCDKDGKNFT